MTEGRPEQERHGAPASEAVATTAGILKAQLGAVAEKAHETIDSAREPIADRLLGTADMLRSQSDRLPRGAAGIAQGVADDIEASATYLVSNTVPQMLEDMLSVVRRHPMRSLLIAGTLGFLIARTLQNPPRNRGLLVARH